MSDPALHSPAGAAPAAQRARRRPVSPYVLFGVPLAWAIGLALAFYFDDQVVAWVVSAREQLREPLQWALMITGFVILVQFGRSLPNGLRLLLGWFVPMLISAAITHLLKWAVSRARPFMDLGATAFEPLRGGGDYASFPSGHTQFAFVLATIWCLYWPRLRWVGLVWAPLVAFERIYSEKHFLSDVLTGAAIGVVTTLFTVKLLGPKFYRMDAGDPDPLVNTRTQDAA